MAGIFPASKQGVFRDDVASERLAEFAHDQPLAAGIFLLHVSMTAWV